MNHLHSLNVISYFKLPGMKKHILLIDNDKEELNYFLEALKKVPDEDGFKCTYANSLTQALEMLKYLVPHFIFINDNKFETDGLQLLAFVKNERRLLNTKFFLYSASISEETNKMAILLGASGCIEKPVSVERLTHELRAVLAHEPIHTYAYFRGDDHV